MPNTPKTAKWRATCPRCNEEKSKKFFHRKDGVCLHCSSIEDGEQLKDEAFEVRSAKQAKAAAEKQAKKNYKYFEKRRSEKAQYDKDRLKTKARERVRESARAENEAERELASRVLARRKLIYFIQKFKPDYEPGWVHEDICDRLERFFKAVEKQEAPRLILAMPPRHGKSEIASKNFPAWILGHRPEFEIIASSYNVSLPMGFSRRVKENIASPTYRQIFPKTSLSKHSQAAEAWMTTKGGGYVAAGVGGGITGKGAHVFIIDDPVKDAEEADSETMREKTWDWWGSTAKTRLAPGGGVLVIQTRWHDDDLSGRMIAQMKEQKDELETLIAEAKERKVAAYDDGSRHNIQGEIDAYQMELDNIDHWEIVSYPAVATDDEFENIETHEIIQGASLGDNDLKYLRHRFGVDRELSDRELHDNGSRDSRDGDGAALSNEADLQNYRLLRLKGEPLHNARFPKARLINMKRSMQPRHWSALYQQNPVPDEGIYFTKSMFRYEPYIAVGHKYNVYIAWDLAIGEKQTNDFTVGAVIGVDYLDQIHVLDIVRGRWDSLGIVDIILDTAARYNPQMIGIERGHLEMAIKPMLDKRIKERKQYFSFAEGKDALVPITDKAMRSRPLQGRMQQGMVFFPSNQPWVEQTVFELMRFPGGVHDDIVDALSWAVRLAMKFPAPRQAKQMKIESWKDKLKAFTRGSDDKHPMAT